MKFNVSAWSIRKPLPAIIFALAVLALGAASFTKLPVTLLPNVDPSIVTVAVTEVGAAPAELESQVTEPVEDAVSEIAGVKHVTSSISDGVSVTTVTFALDVNADRALKDVNEAIARIRGSLPSGLADVKIKRVDAMGLGILTYAALSSDKSPEELSYFVDDVIIKKLQGIPGISAVERVGGVDREIRVTFKPDQLQAAGITAASVTAQLHGLDKDA